MQSNGTAEWLKMSLAQQHGICAATRLQLPGQFQWWLYRTVLGAHAVPERSPLDKSTLAWRLMDRLAGLAPGSTARVTGRRADGSEVAFEAIVRVDGATELEYLRHGGVLRMVLRQLLG